MSKRNKKIEELVVNYEALLGSMDVVNVDAGLLSLQSTVDDGQLIPANSGDKRLVLPIEERLRVGEWDSLLPFHPLSEHILRGQSETLRWLIKVMRFKINSTLSQLVVGLLELAADENSHPKLNIRQSKYLTKVPNASKAAYKALSKLINREFSNLVSIYLKREVLLGEDTYRRVCEVNFPIIKELSNNPKEKVILDVDLGTLRNKETIAAIFEEIIPQSMLDAFDSGSNSDAAPYFDSLLQSYIKLADHLNDKVKMYRTALEVPLEELEINVPQEVRNYFNGNNLPKIKNIIPPLEGNTGSTPKGETGTLTSEAPKSVAATHLETLHKGRSDASEPVQAPVVTAPTVSTGGVQAPVVAPVVASQPTSTSGNGVDFSQVRLSSSQPQTQQQFQQPQQMMQQPMYGQQQFQQQPMQQYQQPMMQPQYQQQMMQPQQMYQQPMMQQGYQQPQQQMSGFNHQYGRPIQNPGPYMGMNVQRSF